MSWLTEGHSGRIRTPRAWSLRIRVAVVVAACQIVAAIVATNIIGVQLNIVAHLASLWVFAASLCAGRETLVGVDRAAG
jgi:hypothetical protein